MPESISRRGFLAKSSIVAASGVAATVAASTGLVSVQTLLAGAPVANAAENASDTDVTPVGHDVIAHVRNESTGEISVMVGEHEVVYTDRALVARLLKNARQAGREA